MIGLEVAQITGFNLIKRSRPSVDAVAMRIHDRHFQLWIWDVPQTDGRFINLITRSVVGGFCAIESFLQLSNRCILSHQTLFHISKRCRSCHSGRWRRILLFRLHCCNKKVIFCLCQ